MCLRPRSHTYSQLSGSFLPDSQDADRPPSFRNIRRSCLEFLFGRFCLVALVFLNFICLFESFIVAVLNMFLFFIVLVVILLFVVVFSVFVVFLCCHFKSLFL